MTRGISKFCFLGLALPGSAFHLPSQRFHPFTVQRLSSSVLESTEAPGFKDNSIETEITLNEEQDRFDWFKAWYPVVQVEILDEEIPHKFQLLGMDLVVWNDGPAEGGGTFGKKEKNQKRTEGTWRAFVDSCPHRMVPLSEGRVENDGSLLCSYHGWRFDGEGSCVAIPQVSDDLETEHSRLISNPKTQCNAFPTKVVDGVLWIWPSSDGDAVLESELTPVNNAKFDEDEDRLWYGPWNYRQLPYSADYFLENVVDPAHVPVSHHNVVGNRYTDLSLRVASGEKLTKDGFSIKVGENGESETKFVAPGLVRIASGELPSGAKQMLELYCSPSKPGFCNHVGRLVLVKDRNGKMESAFKMFTLPMPIWLNHVLASFFLNQDALFLHAQERDLAKRDVYKALLKEDEDPYHYSKAVFPTRFDLGVIKFRNWLRVLAGGKIPYKNSATMPETDREQVFDVWNAHTKYCRYCQGALKNLRKVRFASAAAALVLTVLRPAKLKLLSLVGVISLSMVGLVSNLLIGKMYRYDYSHAHND